MSKYNSNPRDFALELVVEGLVSADHLLVYCLKYRSTDDVRNMLDSNELSPRFDDDSDKIDNLLSDADDGLHDIDMLKIDIENGNFDIDCDNADEYLHDTIVRNSVLNG